MDEKQISKYIDEAVKKSGLESDVRQARWQKAQDKKHAIWIKEQDKRYVVWLKNQDEKHATWLKQQDEKHALWEKESEERTQRYIGALQEDHQWTLDAILENTKDIPEMKEKIDIMFDHMGKQEVDIAILKEAIRQK